MLLLDLFRPKWKNSNPLIRKQAVQAVDDPAVLAHVASSDSDVEVRLEAIGRLWRRAPTLIRLANTDANPVIREAALERLASSELCDLARTSPNRDARLSALDHIPAALAREDWPALHSQSLSLEEMKSRQHVKYLSEIAESAQDPETRADALARLVGLARLRDGPPTGELGRLPEASRPAAFEAFQAWLSLGQLAECQTLDVARTAFTTMSPHLGSTGIVYYAQMAKLAAIRESAKALVPDSIHHRLHETRILDRAALISQRGVSIARDFANPSDVAQHILDMVPARPGDADMIICNDYGEDGALRIITRWGPYKHTFDYYRTGESTWVCYEDHQDYS